MSKLQDLINELCPDGVEYKTIETIFDLKNGYTPSKKNRDYWENGDIPWFRMEDIRANGRMLNNSIQHITPEAVKGSLFPENSIIVATSATIGEHALITVPSLSNQRFTYLCCKDEYREKINMKFIFYYCFILDKWCIENSNVSSFASVDMAKFRKFLFPIPPLEVQQEIVNILDGLTNTKNELIRYYKKLKEIKKQRFEYYREKLLTFEKTTQITTINDICHKISSGGTPLTSYSEYYNGTIPWLRTQEVNWTDIYNTDIKITEEGVKNSSARWIPENCVIVAMYGATAAKVAINKIPLTTNQACCNLEVNSNIANYKYVFYWLCKEYEKLKALGKGSQSNINAGIVKLYPIPIPPSCRLPP